MRIFFDGSGIIRCLPETLRSRRTHHTPRDLVIDRMHLRGLGAAWRMARTLITR